MNILLLTDVYKFSHSLQYKPGITKVYSYLTTRSDKNFKEVMWFGLKYYIEKYIKQPITKENAIEFLETSKRILGSNQKELEDKIMALAELGYLPVEIKALEEGKLYPVGTVLMTITNTLPEFYWVVGFVESLLLKVWFSSTVATYSHEYRKIVDEFYDKTCSPELYFLKDYAVHDFGYRGDSSEESSEISGAAHLLSFKGSDTVPAMKFVDTYYPTLCNQMQSVPASEHSVMCSFGRDGELEGIKHMLKTYPTGIVSIIADTYNLWDFIAKHLVELKDLILARDGKTVIRPDSGSPKDIICGLQVAPGEIYFDDVSEYKGCLKLLDGIFGSTINSKGFKELNPKIGLIYGDGMYLERYRDILSEMESMGYAASNLVIGVGGILRNHTRDTLGFALKASYVEFGDESMDIFKDPITDHSKKSQGGLIYVEKSYGSVDESEFNNSIKSHFGASKELEQIGLLRTVYKK